MLSILGRFLALLLILMTFFNGKIIDLVSSWRFGHFINEFSNEVLLGPWGLFIVSEVRLRGWKAVNVILPLVTKYLLVDASSTLFNSNCIF